MSENAKTTPKDFFLWAGAMVALYWSVVAFIALIFDYINYAFPNPLSYYPADPYQSGISYEMASIIVLFPLFVVLMRIIHNDILKDKSRSNIWVRRWALFLTLFVAGATMAGDLIWVLTSFLNGSDLTAAFLLKAVVVFLVAAAGFMHFMADLWGYWEEFPARARSVGYAAGALALLSIIAGFFIVGTPQQARLARFDSQKIENLQTIQWQIVSYYQQKQKLPATLGDLYDSLSGFTAPNDPQTGKPYTYHVLTPLSFELCADFNRKSRDTDAYGASVTSPYGGKDLNSNWMHDAGNKCFVRTIDPELYPPLTKPAPAI